MITLNPADRVRIGIIVIWSLCCFVIGWSGRSAWDRPAIVPVAAHAQIALGNGAVEAARAPGPIIPLQPVPAGAKPVSTFRAVVAQTTPVLRQGVRVVASQDAVKMSDKPDCLSNPQVTTQPEVSRCEALLQCPAVTVDGTLVTNRDGTPDLLLSANGAPITATYMPAPVISIKPRHLLGIGISDGIGRAGGIGGVVTYDFDTLPITVGADVYNTPLGISGRAFGVIHFRGL